MEQRKGTPYWGIIAETGMWPYPYIVRYKMLMFVHNVINSDERRIARKMILHQMNGGEMKKNWYNEVNYWLRKLELKVEESEITTMPNINALMKFKRKWQIQSKRISTCL